MGAAPAMSRRPFPRQGWRFVQRPPGYQWPSERSSRAKTSNANWNDPHVRAISARPPPRRLLRSRKLGCLELLNLYSKRVEAHNPKLNAIVVLDAERARKRARAADRALAKGEAGGRCTACR